MSGRGDNITICRDRSLSLLLNITSGKGLGCLVSAWWEWKSRLLIWPLLDLMTIDCSLWCLAGEKWLLSKNVLSYSNASFLDLWLGRAVFSYFQSGMYEAKGTNTCSSSGWGPSHSAFFFPTYQSLLRFVLCITWASQVALVIKNPPANAGDIIDVGSIPGLRRFPWRRAWQPTPVFLPGESCGQRSLEGNGPQHHIESDRTKQLDTDTGLHNLQHV